MVVERGVIERVGCVRCVAFSWFGWYHGWLVPWLVGTMVGTMVGTNHGREKTETDRESRLYVRCVGAWEAFCHGALEEPSCPRPGIKPARPTPSNVEPMLTGWSLGTGDSVKNPEDDHRS